MQHQHYIVMTTCPDMATAEKIAHTLLDKKLAACVNILPTMRSIYEWQGKRESSEEHLLLIKTRIDAYNALEETIESLHPYELPEIIAVPITAGLPAYLAWIDEIRTTS